MATVHALRGLRYDPAQVKVGSALAPPYDVISDEQRDWLYSRNLRNIVRVDYGRDEPGDVAGVEDRYTRARGHLDAWQRLGVLVREARESIYVYHHAFRGVEGSPLTRRGLFVTVPAQPWERSEVRPHEGTMSGPKEDRLRLLLATATHTSAVLLLFDRALGLDAVLDEAIRGEPQLRARTRGELDREEHALWVVDDPAALAAIAAALRPARLYVADGHHRFETAAAYAAERRAAEPDAPPHAAFERTLAHLCDAADPALEVLPNHRLVLPGRGVPATLAELLPRLPRRVCAEHFPSLEPALAAAAQRRDGSHAFAVAAADGVALLHAPRPATGSPRARLDVVALQELVLGPGCGLSDGAAKEGALAFTRSVDEAAAQVAQGGASLAVCLNGCTAAEIIAVADAGETMPEKSTYFYPKVPTGLVLAPC